MKLESQLCTQEQATRLWKLGVDQAGYYCYAQRVVNTKPHFNGEMTEWEPEYSDNAEIIETALAQFDGLPNVSAFTVAELGAMLPATIDGLKLVQWPISFKEAATTYGMQYRWDAHDAHHRVYPLHVVFGDSEAQARADLLICLIADGKVSAEEVNQRLQNS